MLEGDTFNIIKADVGKWISDCDIKNMYRNPRKYAFDFQRKLLSSMKIGNKLKEDRVNIQERSLYSVVDVFSKVYMDLGYITEKQFKDLKHMQEEILSNEPKPDFFFVIQSRPENCLENILKRGREGEEKLDVALLKRIHKQHKKMEKTWGKEYEFWKSQSSTVKRDFMVFLDYEQRSAAKMKEYEEYMRELTQ